MAIGYVDPNPNPFHPTRTTNARDVFAPQAPPADPPDEESEPDPMPENIVRIREVE
jgi:hypothetical protein